MTKTQRPETVEQFHAQFLREALSRRAANLRAMADEFDRLAGQVGATSTYRQIAEGAVHELMWGLANLSIERVVNEAANADVERERVRTAEVIATEIEQTVGGYPGNELVRPKVGTGEHLNDAAWAAQIARAKGE